MPEMPCSSVLSTPTNTDVEEEEIPELVENTMLKALYPPVLSPSDEEADREVTAICSAPVYYRVRSRNTRRRRYYTYNTIDLVPETNTRKRMQNDTLVTQAYPVEY